MAKIDEAGLGVYNNYGPRTTDEGRAGNYNVGGIVEELSLDIRGDGNAETLTALLPQGADILGCYVDVSEEFTGVTAIDVGTKTTEAANGITVPLIVGKTTAATGGAWSSPLLVDTEVAVKFTGTFDGSGNAHVVIRYAKA